MALILVLIALGFQLAYWTRSHLDLENNFYLARPVAAGWTAARAPTWSRWWQRVQPPPEPRRSSPQTGQKIGRLQASETPSGRKTLLHS